MEFFDPLVKAFTEHPAATMLVLSLLALAWMTRQLFALQAQRIIDEREQNKAHLATALQVAPLSAKLIECAELLERRFDLMERSLVPRERSAP